MGTKKNPTVFEALKASFIVKTYFIEKFLAAKPHIRETIATFEKEDRGPALWAAITRAAADGSREASSASHAARTVSILKRYADHERGEREKTIASFMDRKAS